MIINSIKSQKFELWPSLPYNKWKNTRDTLHMWVQIVGKVKLALSPFLNQWWETAFYITPRGMTTGRIPYNNGAFGVDFDFISHKIIIQTSNGIEKSMSLRPRSVSEFFKEFMYMLKTLDILVSIYPVPVEIPHPIPFYEDTSHSSYDYEYVEKWWHIQLHTSFIFDSFRSTFRGKSSPIHFFWGSFDLAGTRFSGKKVDPPQIEGIMGKIMKYSEDEENFTFGFWPGDERFPYPAFYAYMYPAPKGCETVKTGPAFSYFNKELSLCILPYKDLRKEKNPNNQIRNFLITTYRENAKLAGWDIKGLEGSVPDNRIKKSQNR